MTWELSLVTLLPDEVWFLFVNVETVLQNRSGASETIFVGFASCGLLLCYAVFPGCFR